MLELDGFVECSTCGRTLIGENQRYETVDATGWAEMGQSFTRTGRVLGVLPQHAPREPPAVFST